MQHSTVKVIDLWAAANLMKSDKMRFVSVSISDDGCIDFTAIKSEDDFEATDYDSIEPIEGNPLL